jgi:putative flippase GtrA
MPGIDLLGFEKRTEVIPLLNYFDKLRIIIRSHKRRMTKSAAVSGTMTLVGFGLLSLFGSTQHGDLHGLILLNAANSVLMTTLSFLATWVLVFNDRNTGAVGGFSRWVGKAVVLGCMGQPAFAVLVGLIGVQFQVAAVIVVVVKAPAAYFLNHKWVFPNLRRSQTA